MGARYRDAGRVSKANDGRTVRLRSEELGRLGELFRAGVPIVILEDDARITKILDGVLDTTNGLFPWGSSVLDLAQNHIPGNISQGDMLRFVPEGIGHIARKILVFDDGTGRPRVEPLHPSRDDRRAPSLPDGLVDLVWDLMGEIVAAATPEDVTFPSYGVEIGLLAYPATVGDLQAIEALLRDSGGQGTRVGQRLDAINAAAAGPFGKRPLNRVYAPLSLVPGIRRLLAWLNDRMKRGSEDHRVPAGSKLIGEPHVDGTKAITALASIRRSIRTEFIAGGEWHELALNASTLTVFPSAWLSDSLGVVPTVHRILVPSDPEPESDATPDITLSLSIIPELPEVTPSRGG